jgi:hypothetical protein
VRKQKKLENPPWSLLVPGAPRLDAEWSKLRLDWWALAWRRDTVAPK